MERTYVQDKHFEKEDFSVAPLKIADYENCIFSNCHLADTDLSGITFMECRFMNCNLSTSKLSKTGFRDCLFNECKLLGLHFETCDGFLFSVSFENCLLSFSSFYKVKLKKTTFKNCNLTETDFTEADLSGSLFENCDFAKAIFENTILEKADFHSSYNYSIDPETNNVKKARFSLSGIRGLLDKYDIEID